MPRVDWNDKQNINAAKAALRTSGTVADAVSLLNQQGMSVTINSLETAFGRRGIKSPGSFCGKGTVEQFAQLESRGGAGADIMFVTDSHHPYHDELAWEVVIKAASVIKPKYLIIGGDHTDCISLSSFDREPSKVYRLVDETDPARREFNRLMRVANPFYSVYLQGNHEDRWERYIAKNAPALHGLTSMREIMLRDHPETKWVPYRDDHIIGKVLFVHDLGHAGKYAGYHTLDAANHCVVMGHTHRGGVAVSGDISGECKFAMQCGWLGDRKQAKYLHKSKMRDWILGFGHLKIEESTGLVWPSFVPILNNSCHVGGKWVSV